MVSVIILYVGLALVLVGLGIYLYSPDLIPVIIMIVGWLCCEVSRIISFTPRKHFKKRRTQFTAHFNCTEANVRYAIDIFLLEKGFSTMNYVGEEVYRKANMFMGPRWYVKYTVNDDNKVLIECWQSYGLPKWIASKKATPEMNLSGFHAFGYKKRFRSCIYELISKIEHLPSLK